MSSAEKKCMDLAMYLPFSIALAGATIYAANKLTYLIVWGQLSPDLSADYDTLLRAIGYSFFIFLGLLGIPRVILYIKGVTKWRWTFLMYWAIPILLIFFIPESTVEYMKLGIAACAWLEVLLLLNPLEHLWGENTPKR